METRALDQSRQEKKHWFWHAIWLCLPIYFDVLVASFIINVFALVGPLFTMNVYDRVVPNNAIETLWVLAIGTLLVTFFDALLKFLRAYLTEIAAKKSDRLISAGIFAKLLNLRIESAPKNVGVFASSLREYDSIRNFLTSSVMLVVIDIPFTVILLAVVYMLAGKIIIVPIAMMLLILLYALIIRTPLYASIAANFENASKKNSLVVESVNGLTDIKQLNAGKIFQNKWENITAAMASKAVISRLFQTSVSSLTGVLIQINTILTVIMGVYMISNREMTMGALIAIMILSSKIIAPVGQLVALISSWNQTQISFDSLKDIMAREEEDNRPELITKDKLDGVIEFKDVTFSYPNADKLALKDINFKINKGEKVIVLGRMGAGKSTIHKLLMGFFRPKEGRILIDGLDINELNMASYRALVNYVPQDFYLFSGSVRENILMGAETTEDKVWVRAITAGGLENFLQSSPRGLDSFVLERGQNLSGGQRQGIAIARTFLRSGELVLLDEPTNSMDSNTEVQVKHFIRDELKDKTMIMTTHKHTMLDLADRVMIIDGGKIVFDGSLENFKKSFMREVPSK